MTRRSNNKASNSIADHISSGIMSNPISKAITFLTATTGAVGNTTLATVTGVVAVQIFAVVGTTTTITGGSTIEVGATGNTAGLLAQVASDALDVNEIWHDGTPDKTIELTSVLVKNIVSQNIVQKITTQPIKTGAVTYYILWAPISANGNVVVA